MTVELYDFELYNATVYNYNTFFFRCKVESLLLVSGSIFALFFHGCVCDANPDARLCPMAKRGLRTGFCREAKTHFERVAAPEREKALLL